MESIPLVSLMLGDPVQCAAAHHPIWIALRTTDRRELLSCHFDQWPFSCNPGERLNTDQKKSVEASNYVHFIRA